MPDPPKLDLKKLPKGRQTTELNILRVTRAAPAAGAEGDEAEAPQIFRLTLATETPVQRYFGLEVLSCQKGAVDLSRTKRGIPFFQEHGGQWLDNPDPSLRVGLLTNLELVNSTLECDAQFSPTVRGQEAEDEMEGGFTPYISVGYVRSKMKQTKTGNPSTGEQDEFLVTRWRPVEGSVVSFPADYNATVQRSADVEQFAVELESTETVPLAEEPNMKKVRNEQGAVIEVADDDPRPAAAPETRSADREAIEIVEMAGAHGVSDHVSDWLKRSLSPNEVSREILKLKTTKPHAQPTAESLEDMPARDMEKYRYSRSILMAAGVIKQDGIEFEVHRELEKRNAGLPNKGGIQIPLSLGISRRSLASNAPGKGAEMVFEQPGDLIELLRNRAAVLQLGARMLTGLTAPVAFPKQTGAMTAVWVGENPGAIVTASDVALALATLTPKTLMATTAYSRQLLATASIDVEGMVREELAAVHALAIDFAVIHGLGAAGEPQGIYKALNVAATAVGGAMTYPKALAMVGQVATANADLGSLGWLLNPTMAANLRGVLTFPSANTGTAVWQGDSKNGSIAGYTAFASNQMSKTMTGSERTGGSEIGTIFGNWADVLVGAWGSLEVLVNPYSQSKQGLIEVTSFQLADTLVRHGESFSKSTGATG